MGGTERDRPGRRAARRAARRVVRGIGWTLALAALGAGVLAWRLADGAVELPPWTVARLEERVGRDLARRDLSLGRVSVGFDAGEGAFRLRLRDARLTEDGATLVAVPEARVALDGAALLRGRLRPRAVAVEGLSVEVARDADGRFSLAFGAGGGALPATWKEALDTLDAALAAPFVAGLDAVEVAGIELRLSDAATGLRETVEDGTVSWRRDGGGVRLALGASLRLGGSPARLRADIERRAPIGHDGAGAEAHVAVEGLSLAALARTLPNVPALTILRGTIGAEATMALSEDGVPGPLVGRIEARDAALVDRPALALDRVSAAFAWRPGEDRIALERIEAGSDALATAASGQILLEDGLVGAAEMQLRLGPTTFDPDGLLDRSASFDEGSVALRLTQDPLALRIGQAMVAGPSGTARLSGRLAFAAGGIDGSMGLDVPEMAVGDLLALWPPSLQPRPRAWLRDNLRAGRARDATALLRLEPGATPRVEASFAFSDATFRYMRTMPAATGASGAAQLSGDRFALRVDAGSVPAVGPGEAGTDTRVDVAGTTFAIPDTRARPARGEVDLRVAGAIPDMLVLLDNPPFRLLERLGRGPDLAAGRAEARVAIGLPLRPGNAPADVGYAVEATLRDVESGTLVPGLALAADALALDVAPGRVTITGSATLAGVPFTGRYEQALPPPATARADPEAPPPPPVPLPEPGRIVGTARLDPEGLARLGVSVAAIDLRGETDVAVDLALPQGGRPALSLATDLVGVAAGIGAIGWSKGRERAAELSMDVLLGGVPEIARLSFAGPGLSARGRVTFRPDGGGLGEARFDRVRTAWFEGPVALVGRGPGAAPGIRVGGGSADLRRALAAIGTGDGGGSSPVDLALDRLQVTQGIALTDLRTALRSGAGRFTGRINGAAPVEGLVGPDVARDGTAVQATAADAGLALRAAGLFADARGGRLSFTLRPTPQAGVYDGAVRIADLRVVDAPALASLLQTLSVVGILEQLTGEGLFFPSVEADFTLRPTDILVRRASAVGPSMSITADGRYDVATGRVDLEGVISPIYLVNGLFGALFARRDEGLFGFTYRMTGLASDPDVSVNPLSILTPGGFRDIFRRAPPS